MKSRKVMALLAAAVMTLPLAACGGEATDSSAESKQESSQESTQESSPEADDASGDAEASQGEDTEQGTEGQGTDYDALLEDIIPDETVTLDVFTQLANYSGEQVGWFAQVMLEKFNVKLNIIPDPDGAGVYETRMESGNLGDIVVWGHDADDYLNAVNKDMLFGWEEEDLLDTYGPYIKEHMPYALEKNREISGGTLYGFGGEVVEDPNATGDFTYSWDLRWDLYKELGYPEIKNLDDLVEVLAQMKEICPTDDNGKPTYGVSLFSDWDGDMVMYVKSMASAYYGYDEFGVGLYDPTEQVFHPALEEGGPYLEMLKFHNTLYRRDLLDPDSMTQGFSGMAEDYQNGTAFWNIFGFLGSSAYNTETHTSQGKGMFTMSPSEATPISYGLSIYGNDRLWTIGSKTQYPELCMAIINWLCTPEGRMTMSYGPKDVCWYYDENGKTVPTELGRAVMLDGKKEMSDGYTGAFADGGCQINNTTWSQDAANPDSNGETYNRMKWASFAAEPQSEIEADWREYTGFATRDEFLRSRAVNFAPATTYSASVKPEELTVIWNQVTECIRTKSWEAIYAKDDAEFDKIVQEMITKAEEYGYAQCVEFQENEAKIRKACEDAVSQ